MRVLILGASGMIGSAMLKIISENSDLEVIGTIRHDGVRQKLPDFFSDRLIAGIDLRDADVINELLLNFRPDVVINCVGVTKHLPDGNNPLTAIALNALMPHRLALMCKLAGSRLIHISTDCIFSGKKGMYKEFDFSDAEDVYGKTKYLGEINDKSSLTLRTSTIGHEYGTSAGLLEWFLSQKECKGYQGAIFSGLTTIELAKVIRDIVIPNKELTGLYNVGGEPIDKYSLLQLINNEYQRNVEIIPDNQFKIDRSLNIELFSEVTGYKAPSWKELIANMRQSEFN